MKWYVPSMHGDLRLMPGPTEGETLIVAYKPTPREIEVLGRVLEAAREKKWTVTSRSPQRHIVGAPIAELGPVATRILSPGPAVLTAVRFKDGRVETSEHAPAGELEALAKKPSAEAAATVSRPTPCCPDCYREACEPATEVLLSFLTPAQHETWAAGRFVVVQGNLTGHHYIVAHRHSPIAERNRRICWDADDRGVLHFHDWSVPPEEEVLAAMLCLEHREHWLRNEATCLTMSYGESFPVGRGEFERVYKNPFGDAQDGVMDAHLTRMAGIVGKAMQQNQEQEAGS